MIEREQYIKEGLNRHLEEFQKHYPDLELFCLCLQGSQNYGLDIYTNEYKSDIDTKVIIIPSLEDVVMNRKPISTTHVLPNNEHLDIKDIRLYFDNFKKQNINFLEILFTNYYLVNPKYEDLWQLLVYFREEIAHYNKNAALRCMAGMSMEKRKALCHPYPSIIDKIEKYGYDGKQLHHIIRMYDFICGYAQGDSFKKCLKSYVHSRMMMKAKLNQYSLEEAIQLADFFDLNTKTVKDLNLTEQDEINKTALKVLNDIQYAVIKRKIKAAGRQITES